MRRLNLGLLNIFFVMAGGPVFAQSSWVSDDRPLRFCLQNFNAYGPIYASGIAERTSRMSSELQGRPKCEVVHLQEVWNAPQIRQIEQDLKHQYSISAPNKDQRIGLMSLFMGDVIATDTRSFQVNNEGGVMDGIRDALNVKKAFHVVRAGFFGIDEQFYFVNTHLHPSSEAVRVTQLLDLLEWRLRHQDAKLLLSGDFNADVNSLERGLVVQLLSARDAMEEALGGYPNKGYCTYCAGNPLGWLFSDRVFDYIFYSNVGDSPTRLRVEDGRVNMRGTPRRPLSDHFGVRVQFSVLPSAESIKELKLARLEKTLQTLRQAEALLLEQKGREFAPYLSTLRDLQAQLESRSGRFFDYFSLYR